MPTMIPTTTTDYADEASVSFTKVSEDYTALLGQKVKVMFKDGKTNNVLGVYAILGQHGLQHPDEQG